MNNAYEINRYDENTRIESRLEKLQKEVRVHVKYISNYKIFSQEWIDLEDSLTQISELAFTEKTMPIVKKDLSNIQGRTKYGTLWDQENGEVALKILVEEGKLNLCLRLLLNLRETQSKPNFHSIIASHGNGVCTSRELIQIIHNMERSLTIIIYLSIQHTESLQICDIKVLVNVCSLILDNADEEVKNLRIPKTSKFVENFHHDDKHTQNVIFHILYYLIFCIPSIPETTMMDAFKEYDIFLKIINTITKHKDKYSYQTYSVVGKFYHLVFKTDMYQLKTNKILSGEIADIKLVELFNMLEEPLKKGFLKSNEISALEMKVYSIKKRQLSLNNKSKENKEGDSIVDKEEHVWNNLLTTLKLDG